MTSELHASSLSQNEIPAPQEHLLPPSNEPLLPANSEQEQFNKLINIIDQLSSFDKKNEIVSEHREEISKKEEYVKNLKGTTFIKKKFILGFSVVGTDLVALIVNSPVPVIMASYTSEEDAIEALEHFVTTGTYKTEKIKLDETGLKALDLLVEEISK